MGGAPLDKLSVVVPPITANAAQTEIYKLTNSVPTIRTHPSPPLSTQGSGCLGVHAYICCPATVLMML